VLDSIRMSVWESEPPRKPLNLDTLIRNALSLQMFLSEVKFSKGLLFPTKCKELLLSEEIISTMFLNTTDMKRDIEIFQYIVHQLLQLKKETSQLLGNVDLLPRLFISTFLRLSLMKLLVMLENNLCSSDVYKHLYDLNDKNSFKSY